jgi:hypothetical protein
MATLICAAVAASIALAYPTEVTKPGLGDEWECRQSVIVTTCHRVGRAEPIVDRAQVHLSGTPSA